MKNPPIFVARHKHDGTYAHHHEYNGPRLFASVAQAKQMLGPQARYYDIIPLTAEVVQDTTIAILQQMANP